jgi:hypothetical protein
MNMSNDTDNDFTNAMTRALAYGIARILNMDMEHAEALELAGINDTPPTSANTDND